MDLETKIESYEDLTKDKSSDKYEYIFPSYEFSKELHQIIMVIMKLFREVITKITILISLKKL